MSALTRRGMLKAGALAGAVAVAPAGIGALRRASMVIYDGALPESRAFARTAGMARRLDLTDEHRTRFATIREGLSGHRGIEGLTRWSDWVALRGELESKGWRIASEQRTGKRGDLFRWSMQRG